MSLKVGEFAADFDSRFWGIEATVCKCLTGISLTTDRLLTIILRLNTLRRNERCQSISINIQSVVMWSSVNWLLMEINGCYF